MTAVESVVSLAQWRELIETVQARDAIWWEQTTKSGNTQMVNLRDRLFELELVRGEEVEPQRRKERKEEKDKGEDASVILRYVGSCRNDGSTCCGQSRLFLCWSKCLS